MWKQVHPGQQRKKIVQNLALPKVIKICEINCLRWTKDTFVSCDEEGAITPQILGPSIYPSLILHVPQPYALVIFGVFETPGRHCTKRWINCAIGESLV
jgi:hypothetical protein